MIALKANLSILIDGFVDWVHDHTLWITYSKSYERVSSMVILLNPVSIAPQVYKVLTAPSVEGVSPMMWIVFALVQLAILFEGVKMRRPVMFYSMFISIIESAIILTTVLIRS